MKDLIEAQGITSVSYMFQDERVLAEFESEPVRAETAADYFVYRFGENRMSNSVIDVMNADGYAPANLRELLSWKWDDRTDIFVAALGTTFKGFGQPELKDEYTPFLRSNLSGKQLSTARYDAWGPEAAFLAVRINK